MPGGPRSGVGGRRSDGAGQGEGEAAAGRRSTTASSAKPAVGQLGLDALAAELRRDLGAQLLARREAARPGRGRATLHAACARLARSRISIHSCSASQTATWSNASTSKSAPSSRLSTVQHVAVELGGHAGRVVVRARPGRRGSFTRSVPSSSHSPGSSTLAHRGEERRPARPGSRLPMVPPRNATSRGPLAGQRAEVLGEVADDAVDREARVVARRSPRPPRAAPPRETSSGTNVVQRAVRRAARRAAAGSSPTSPSRARPASWRRCARRSRRRARRGSRARPGSGSTPAAG